MLLQPYHTNIGKRLTKSQKLYFYDTGLACSLLNIESANQLPTHYLRGGLVESMVITELHKQRYNAGFLPNFYFWRDKEGNEVDCLMVKGTELIPIEIKAGQSISTSYFDGLNYWNDLFKQDQQKSFVVYAGDENQPRAMGNVVSWRSIDDKIKTTI